MTTKVTIAIPTYNRADRFLAPALECALAQNWSNLELIVSDNCSTDNTADVVRSYSDSRIRYVRQSTNIGPNNNFNYCVNEASGDYFLLYHDDDAIDADFVSRCMAAADGRTDYGVIRTGTRLIDADGQVVREIPNLAGGLGYTEFFRGWMRGNFTSYVCSTLFNTRLLREVGGFQSKHGLFQDMIAVAKLIARAGHCDVEEVKASFRRHEENYGNAADLKAWCEDGLQLAQVIASEAPDAQEELYQESIRYLCWTVYGYANRFLPSRIERIKAYRMIDNEFGRCYPFGNYVFDKTVKKKYRAARRYLSAGVKRLVRYSESA
jgi:glycosyltransferase involved in cell wall biosynthesis